MTAISDLSSLIPDLVPDLPGAEDGVILRQLRTVARDFMAVSRTWIEEMPPQILNDYQEEYRLSWSTLAEVHQVLCVRMNGQEVRPAYYSLVPDLDILRLHRYATPTGADRDDLLLVCGTVGTTTLGDWQAITDGSVIVSLDGTTHELTDLDFSGAADIEDVARTIQTALRVEADRTDLFVRYFDNVAGSEHFCFFSHAPEMAVLQAGTVGTDVSGAGYLNGATGAGTVGPLLEVKAVLRPHQQATTLPGWVLERNAEALQAKVRADLMLRPKMPYSDPERGAYWRGIYHVRLTEALSASNSGFTTHSRGFTA